MLTDDPGTPGNGNFELNLAATLTGSRSQRVWEVPNFDLNYGVGPTIQLNFATAVVLLKRADRDAVGGLGAASLAVKWRFLEQGKDGFAVSTYPRVERSVFDSSVRQGLADDGTRFFLPVEVAHPFGPIGLDVEVGPLLSTVGRSEWDYGVVAGTAVNKSLNLMAEIHGSIRAGLIDDTLTVNVGLRQAFTKSVALIASVGHDVRAPSDAPLQLVSYCGLQLEF
jgi:hypothetical protein